MDPEPPKKARNNIDLLYYISWLRVVITALTNEGCYWWQFLLDIMRSAVLCNFNCSNFPVTSLVKILSPVTSIF
ncbi:hypothetical protein R3W88_004935 [Solanum pinnatisectum]|uniref:Uncharacterized protein n=1 Tax=Solanum pinnatisectum TaxID=50273 RepID=A0AAV9KAQ0_9SOLN|nr:hypothetical protein R3W88_004935 [Solanum pinnatisectum]